MKDGEHFEGPDTRIRLPGRARHPEGHDAWQRCHVRYRACIALVGLQSGSSSRVEDVVPTVFCQRVRLPKTYEPSGKEGEARDEFRRVLIDRAMELARRRMGVCVLQLVELGRCGHGSHEIGSRLGMTRGPVDKALVDAPQRLAGLVEDIQATLS